jgi:hypothetical protein
MGALETELDRLIELIKPVPFDWYVPWQDMYSGTALALRVGATISPPDQETA